MDNINIPMHVGIIMDGNGRWAKERGLIRSQGHLAGSKAFKKIVKHGFEMGIKYLSFYAFSTENFKRSEDEVNYLMNLFVKFCNRELAEFKKSNVRVVFSGRRKPLSDNVLNAMDKIVEETKNGTKGVLNICLNYGGQYEILDMVNKVVDDVCSGSVNKDDLSLEVLNKYMYNDLPMLDYVIRTSGELRTSNFMIWQSAYAEYYFPKVYFPDFDEKEFDLAIEEYQKRKRRFGGV